MIDSTSHIRVCKDSSSKRLPCSRSRVSRIRRVVRICLSQTAPIWLAAGGLNFQSMFCWRSFSVISFWSISLIASRSSRLAPTKLVPLSLLISRTWPRRVMRRRSAWRKESVSREWATSIWTALLTRHVNSAPYLLRSFNLLLLCTVQNGPLRRKWRGVPGSIGPRANQPFSGLKGWT